MTATPTPRFSDGMMRRRGDHSIKAREIPVLVVVIVIGFVCLIGILSAGDGSSKHSTWKPIVGNDARKVAPKFVQLRNSGAIEVSNKVVNLDRKDWSFKDWPSFMRSVAKNWSGGYDVNTVQGHTYTVAVGQPFIFQQDREHLFVMDEYLNLKMSALR